MGDNGSQQILIALGQFGALIGRGLAQIMHEDPRARIIATDLDIAALEKVVEGQTPPRVVVLDESAVTDRHVLLRLRAAARPTVGIVVLFHRPTRAQGARLLAAGGTCLSKDADAEDVVTTIHLAARGKHMFVELDSSTGQSRLAEVEPLTAREEEILERLRVGESTAQVAAGLCISVETVRSHAAKIRRKLRVKSTAELVDLHPTELAARPQQSTRC